MLSTQLVPRFNSPPRLPYCSGKVVVFGKGLRPSADVPFTPPGCRPLRRPLAGLYKLTATYLHTVSSHTKESIVSKRAAAFFSRSSSKKLPSFLEDSLKFFSNSRLKETTKPGWFSLFRVRMDGLICTSNRYIRLACVQFFSHNSYYLKIFL